MKGESCHMPTAYVFLNTEIGVESAVLEALKKLTLSEVPLHPRNAILF